MRPLGENRVCGADDQSPSDRSDRTGPRVARASARAGQASARRDGRYRRADKPYVPPSARKSVEVGNYYLRKKKYNAALSRYQEAVETDPYKPATLASAGYTKKSA
ncbi:MAG: hypothetical protein DMG27_03155 [Acidobacteria bacterium]|nr:MAG: hypothetical protein DMG27_03155 [Acidobacteriota bacterium]